MNIYTVFTLNTAAPAQAASQTPTTQLVKLGVVGVGFAPPAQPSVLEPFVDVDALVAATLFN